MLPSVMLSTVFSLTLGKSAADYLALLIMK